jgi:nucleotide-binding universal stress UspA family protein
MRALMPALFTLVVTMAIETTLTMPHTLRAALQAGEGFGLLWIGVEPAVHASVAIHDDVSPAVAGFDGNCAIVFVRGALVADRHAAPLNMLLAVTGTAYSSRAADLALALAHARAGRLRALYVDPEAAARRSAAGPGRDAARAILKELKEGQYDLLVMGVTARSGDDLFCGPVPSAVPAGSPESLLLIAT